MPVTNEEVYKIHRDYLEHEDELVHHRTTALITIQSFLIATFGFTYQKKYEIAEKLFSQDKSLTPAALGSITDEYNGFLFILAIVGAATSYIAWRSILAATYAIKALESNWLQFCEHNPPEHLPGLTGGGIKKSTGDGISLATWAPMFLLILWLATIAALLVFVKIGLKP